MEIYVALNNERYGPYSREEVEAFLADGTFSAANLAWHAGLDGWRRLGDFVSPALPVPSPATPPPLRVTVSPATPAAGRLDFGEALMFPLRGGRGLGRIWWLPFAALVPVFASILLRGWRLDLVRRVSRNDSEPLPDGRDLGRFLSDGVVLLVMGLMYHLPLAIFVLVFGMKQLTAALEILWWALQKLFAEGAASFWTVVADVALGLLMDLIAPAAYLILVWPLHRMAMVRFALTGRFRSFFQIWKNLRLCLRFMPEIFLAFFIDFVALRLLRWIARALITVGVGAVFAPVASALYYWTTGHIFGQLAAKVAEPERT